MYILNIFFIFILILLDQITKYISFKFLMPINEIKVINNFFYLTYVENRGMAFGIFQGGRWFFIIFTIIFFIAIFKYYKNLNSKIEKFTTMLILSGAIGNFIDRLFFGYVKDFLNLYFFKIPVFNFADSYIVIGITIYIFYKIFILKKDKNFNV